MPAEKKYTTNRAFNEKRLNFNDAELFERMEKIFVSRGYGGLSLTKQAKIVFGEWCDAQEKSRPTN